MEFCLNQNNGNGVYPNFQVTYRDNGAAAPQPTYAGWFNTAGHANANPVSVKCLCSKCRTV